MSSIVKPVFPFHVCRCKIKQRRKAGETVAETKYCRAFMVHDSSNKKINYLCGFNNVEKITRKSTSSDNNLSGFDKLQDDIKRLKSIGKWKQCGFIRTYSYTGDNLHELICTENDESDDIDDIVSSITCLDIADTDLDDLVSEIADMGVESEHNETDDEDSLFGAESSDDGADGFGEDTDDDDDTEMTDSL